MDKQIWYMHTMEYYLVLKRNAVLIYAKTWMNFENIVLNEVCVLVAQSRPTLCGPWTVAHKAPLSMGFSRQKY